ncbi:MAG: secretin and TonB N-terminal domain-containing protein [Microthrixaceae bacterium]
MIKPNGLYEHLAYQSDNTFTIELRPLTKEEEVENKKKFGYTGERLSLNFQNIEVRAVLQLIADFTEKNLVASDTVGGNVTLRLKNVPWDQALDIILKSRGLDKREIGNVMMVAPQEEIANREKLEMESKKQVQELGFRSEPSSCRSTIRRPRTSRPC